MLVGGYLRLTSLPFVQQAMRSLVLNALQESMFIPHGIEVPLFTVPVAAGARAQHGAGLLRVHVRRAIGLPQQAMTVQSALGFAAVRPVCVAEVRAAPVRTGSVVGEGGGGGAVDGDGGDGGGSWTRARGPIVGGGADYRVHTAPSPIELNPVWDERLEVLVPTRAAYLRCVETETNICDAK